jgi:hypothetical protein
VGACFLLVACTPRTRISKSLKRRGDSEQHARHYRRILISQGGIISVLTMSKRRPEIADACRRAIASAPCKSTQAAAARPHRSTGCNAVDLSPSRAVASAPWREAGFWTGFHFSASGRQERWRQPAVVTGGKWAAPEPALQTPRLLPNHNSLKSAFLTAVFMSIL